jgi:RimJ/RimL family protein N-acetyltransferase
MNIETKRLELTPLTLPLLKYWIEDVSALERELDCSYQAEPMEGLFLDIVRGQLEIMEKEPENYLWHSFWFLIRKCDRTVVGSFVFKGVPNDKGEVEIGYGLGSQFEHNGYMTEAVNAMCNWAFDHNVTSVIAETDLDGFTSQRILQRCGFSEEIRGDTVWWRNRVQ